VADSRNLLKTKWRATASGPFFEATAARLELVEALTDDCLAAIEQFGGFEGFLGETYLRLYRVQELDALNQAYNVPSLLPEAIVFASDGCGEAFASLRGRTVVVRVPFLPLAAEYMQQVATGFGEFVSSLAASGESPMYNADAIGMEVHNKHPICFGGSPTDPANTLLVPVVKHAELCRFWNGVYRQARARQLASPANSE
jgi:hypothetical protein